MAVEQTLTLNTSKVDDVLVDLERVIVNLTQTNPPLSSVRYDSSVDSEVSFSGSGPYSISINTEYGNDSVEGSITLYFSLTDGKNCIKSIAFTPSTIDCLSSSLGPSESFITFVTDGVESNGKLIVNGVETCFIIVNLS